MAKAILALAILALCRAQAPIDTEPPLDPAKLATLEGQVLNLTGEPIQGATVHLQAAFEPELKTVTDAEGHFGLSHILIGQYTLSAESPGYVRKTYESDPLRLSAGQRLTGVSIKMTPEAVISGRVLDENGEPLANTLVTVLAFRRFYDFDWQREQRVVTRVPANPDGTFSLKRLSPGYYYVSVNPDYDPNEKTPPETYVTTWYPKSLDISSASGIDVNSGQEASGIEIQMQKTAAYRISGRVNVTPPFSIALQPENIALNNLSFSIHQKDTSFKFTRLLPGTYVLHVSQGDSEGPPNFARQVVSIGRDNVDDLVITPGPGAEVTGKLKIEGNPPPETIAHFQIVLQGGLHPAFNFVRNAQVDKTARRSLFTACKSPLFPPAFTSNPCASVIRTSPALDSTSPLAAVRSKSPSPMAISPSAGASDITAALHASDGSPLPGVPVSLWFAGPPAGWGPIIANTPKTDSNGAVHFGNLAPGNYCIAAWETDPLAHSLDFLRALDDHATPVKLEENTHATVEPKLIPRAEIEAQAWTLR